MSLESKEKVTLGITHGGCYVFPLAPTAVAITKFPHLLSTQTWCKNCDCEEDARTPDRKKDCTGASLFVRTPSKTNQGGPYIVAKDER